MLDLFRPGRESRRHGQVTHATKRHSIAAVEEAHINHVNLLHNSGLQRKTKVSYPEIVCCQ